MSYPDNFLRGFSDESLLAPDGVGVSAAVFYFDASKINNGWLEQSVCWEDDGSVVGLMLGQKNKDRTTQFKAAIVRVPRSCVHYINKLPQTKGLLSYERKELDENPYHGNLLLKKDTHKITMTRIAAVIAVHVLDVINQE